MAQSGSAHGWGPCGRWFESSRSDHSLVRELPLKLLKSRAKRVICSFAAILDSVKVFCCSPVSGSSCGYIAGTFWNFIFLYPHFFCRYHPSLFPSTFVFLFRGCHFFRGLIVLVDARLVLIPHFHSLAGQAPFQGYAKFQQGFYSLHPIPIAISGELP